MSTRSIVRPQKPSASVVSSTQNSLLQQKCASRQRNANGDRTEHNQHDRLQKKSKGAQLVAPPIVNEVLRSPGEPLDRNTRSFMEERFGQDFSGVRIHTDARAARSASEVNALAYTVGSALVFGTGQYVPQSAKGKRLLAHELVHSVQNRASGLPSLNPLPAHQTIPIGSVGDSLEIEAERISALATENPAPFKPRAIRPALNSLQVRRQVTPGSGARAPSQGDVPGELPSSIMPLGRSEYQIEIRIDGDGDQYKELVLRLDERDWWPSEPQIARGPVKTMVLQVEQISTGQTRKIEFNLPRPSFGGYLFPIVTEVTDGHAPTRISLVTPDIDNKRQWLDIFPPAHTDKGLEYPVVTAGKRFPIPFPPEKNAAHKVAISGGRSEVIGNIVSIDMVLGAYRDHFGITIRPVTPTKAELGVSELYEGKPADTKGAEIKTSGAIRYQVIDTGPVSFGIDLDGDGTSELVFFDRLTAANDGIQKGSPEKDRDHRIRVTGSAIGAEEVFDFQVRYGVPRSGAFNPTGANKAAESNALAVRGLSEQAKAGGFQNQLDAAELALMKVRRDAADNSVIQRPTYEAWKALSVSMIRLQAQTKQAVDSALQDEAAKNAAAFFNALATETASATIVTYHQAGSSSRNPYTGERASTIAGRGKSTSGPGPSLEGDIRAGQWSKATTDYQELVAGLDRWIIEQLTIKRGAGEAREAERLEAQQQNLRGIEKYKPERVLAVFHPDEKFRTETGYIAELPLSLYYWREGDSWHLKDVTNPSKTYEYTVEVVAGELEPSSRLLQKLNDPDHFPAGIVHFEIPGRYAGTITTTDDLTWKKFFAYLSLGLAAVGLTLTTFGTGTVAVIGAWALGSSAVLGALSAGIDLGEHIQQGNLDATTAILDVTQIVAGLAGAGTIASGAIVRSAATAPAGARWSGAWARTAMVASRVYLPASKITAAADVVTLAIIFPETVKQLESIESGPGDPTDKKRAKILLLTQAAVLGGLSALSVKGLIADPAKLPTLVLHPGPDGVPVVSTALSKNSVVLDTNAAIAFDRRAKNLPLDPGHKAAIKRVESLGDVDLRIADPTIGEMAAGGASAQEKGIGVTADRAGPEYQKLLTNLTDKDPVGGKKPKATIDQQIVADTFFAVSEPGATPTLATADSGIYNPLSRRAGYNPSAKGAGIAVPVKFPNGFDVTINGRTIHVQPLK